VSAGVTLVALTIDPVGLAGATLSMEACMCQEWFFVSKIGILLLFWLDRITRRGRTRDGGRATVV